MIYLLLLLCDNVCVYVYALKFLVQKVASSYAKKVCPQPTFLYWKKY